MKIKTIQAIDQFSLLGYICLQQLWKHYIQYECNQLKHLQRGAIHYC